MERFDLLIRAIHRTLESVAESEVAAEKVIAQLLPTIAACDDLDFDASAECAAYLCWHLSDRYGRIQHALDILAAQGDLPIRRKGLSLLEIGAGPAPATYAVRDYYRSFVDWCVGTSQELSPAPLSHASLLDRGPAWNSFLHMLSENLLAEGTGGRDPLPFGLDYDNFEQFSVRRYHDDSISRRAASILQEAEALDEYMSERDARAYSSVSGGHPPSAYDLIVMSNFLTHSAMTDDLGEEILEMSRSLTPGGILLVLGGSDPKYREIYSRLNRLMVHASGRRLKRVASRDCVPAQADSLWEGMASRSLIANLSTLRLRSPSVFFEQAKSLPPDVRKMDPSAVTFPNFAMHAFKREGAAAFTKRDLDRLARRGETL